VLDGPRGLDRRPFDANYRRGRNREPAGLRAIPKDGGGPANGGRLGLWLICLPAVPFSNGVTLRRPGTAALGILVTAAIVLWDRKEIRVWAFSHSVVAELVGDRSLHRAVRLAHEARRNAPAGPDTLTHIPRTTIHVRWWMLPVVIVVGGAVIVTAWLIDPAATLT
jgi:hypothetical protein